jgi:hypothetical protein
MATAGCGAFTLVGVLITVGLVVWLGSRVLPDSDDSPLRSSTSVTAPGDPRALEVTLDPAEGLDETTTLVATVEGLDPGAKLRIATCLRGGSLVIGADAPCDDASAREANADEDGAAIVPYHPARLITAGGLPFDCAAHAATCEVRVTQATGSSGGGGARSGAAAFSYKADLPPPEITVPGGG